MTIFEKNWTALGLHGTHVSALLRNAFFTLFTQAPGAAFTRFSVDFWRHFEAFSAGFWAGVESVIFEDTTLYSRYFEGPRVCNLASFGHCFSGDLPAAPFLLLLDVFGVPGIPF